MGGRRLKTTLRLFLNLSRLCLIDLSATVKIFFPHIFLQPLSLGLFRCDYFFCCQKDSCLQVEFNTVASSFGGISTRLSQAHKLV